MNKVSSLIEKTSMCVPLFAPAPTWILSAVAIGLLASGNPGFAQSSSETADKPAVILSGQSPQDDARMTKRLEGIYSEIDKLAGLSVTVREGVITVSGEVANEAQADEALAFAGRIDGAVTVEDNIDRTLSVTQNLDPILSGLVDTSRGWLRAAPLYGVALLIFFAVAYIGHRIAAVNGLWRRVLPNPFLADLAAQAFRAVAICFGLVVALNLVGASALVGTILGGLGVFGIAIGFAIRDTMENYISSIMLSLRQPFRRDDHVVINEHEGIVVRLTSRATILMTLDGNHLRIPNSTVFKGTILNYTRNPQRRFDFVLGVDADDDPGTAMTVGLVELRALEWISAEPEPTAIIDSVGDSNILIRFMGWIDQTSSDFGKSRSLAIRAVKLVLEKDGFTLPEPIYRLRFDSTLPLAAREISTNQPKPVPASPAEAQQDSGHAERGADEDVSPESSIVKIAAQERIDNQEEDLLDGSLPTE